MDWSKKKCILSLYQICFNMIKKVWSVFLLCVHTGMQDVIVSYLESCKRKPVASNEDLDENGLTPDTDVDEDDPQSQQEFDEFKKWLDESAPSSEPPPKPTLATVATPSAPSVGDQKCAKCGLVGDCPWISVVHSTAFELEGFVWTICYYMLLMIWLSSTGISDSL